jgi:hypothetical protein
VESSFTETDNFKDNVQVFNCGSLVATGSTSGNATAIIYDTVFATSTGGSQGLILPAGCYRVAVWNNNPNGGNAINIYPPAGAAISTGTTGAAFSLTAHSGILLCEIANNLLRIATLS